MAGPEGAAPVAAAVARPDTGGSMPLWPWITGGAVLLGTGYAVARRLSRAPDRQPSAPKPLIPSSLCRRRPPIGQSGTFPLLSIGPAE